MQMTSFHEQYYANALFHSVSGSNFDNLIGILSDSNVDINPHQVEAVCSKIPFLPRCNIRR